jgi:hypothetical protein
MNFFLKLLLTGAVAGPLAAAPSDDGRTAPMGTDSMLVESIEGIDLNHSYTIKNPYAESADKPFTFTTKAAAEPAAPLANKVSCGGRIWTDGELLGHTGDGKSMIVRLQDNRIYLNWGGTITDNIFVLFYLVENTFPNNATNGPLIDACVNPLDPSTASVQLLGKTGDGKITCNGYVMPDGDLLGTYVADWGETRQHIRIVDGLLRVGVQQGPNDHSTGNLQMTLINFTIDGANGSYLAPKWRGILTKEMVNGCFWPRVPKPATPVVDSNCSSGPTLGAISSITQTGLKFNFTGTGVSTIKWRIKSGITEVRSGTTPDLGASKTVTLSYTSLAAGNYSLEIEGANCSSVVSKSSFKIDEPVVGTPNCANGPSVTTIKSITPSSLTVDFAGTNLHIFSWRVLSGSNAVGSGKTGYLNSNSTSLEFPYLNNGTYTLEIKPEDCVGTTATKNFSISATDTRTACSRGPILESVLASGETSVEFRFDGNNVFAIDWKITNGTTVLRQNRVAPQNNHPVIQFEKLPTGAYTIEIQGGNCKSAVTSARFGVGVALPIYIANFQGEIVEKGVELTWDVVAEQDGKEFEVLRYDDKLKNEEVLGKVSLTDQRVGKYRFVDESPLLGINYYQLKQIDIDGTFTKSKIITINPGIITGKVVAPNPAQDYIDIQFSSRTSGTSQVKIFDISGLEVSSSPIEISEGRNVHRVQIKKLKNGNYFMKISHGGELSKLRFTKMN